MYAKAEIDTGLTEGQQQINIHQATALRNRADAKTRFREQTAPLLGVGLAIDNGEHAIITVVNASLAAASEYSDITDGMDARKASALLNEPTTVEGGEADHNADKKKFIAQMLGLVIRTIVHEGDYRQASFIGVNGVVQVARDQYMAKTREEAMSLGIDGKARNIGKAKAWANGIGAGLHTITPILPEKTKQVVQKAGNASLAAGTLLSLAGLSDMKWHVHKSKQELRKQS